MCGIYGFARMENSMSSLERHKLRGMVMDLALRNEARGKDGTGIALMSASGSILFKEALPSSKLIKTKRFQKVISMITDETLLCLGHTRLATIGSVDNKHCHPFLTDDFVGVHNGHFMNREDLLKKHGKSVETSVDSEAIFRVLDGDIDPKAIGSKLSEMEGDFALGFAHRGAPHRLYLVRNEVRPLHVAYVSPIKTLFWASDDEHLEYALARNSLKASVWEIKEDRLYAADVRNFNGKSNMKKMPCKMPVYQWPETKAFAEDDFQPGREPRLYSYEELEGFGCLEGSGMTQHSKIACAGCQGVTEAGELFYEEMSGKFLCEDCSFDFLYNHEERERRHGVHGESRDLFDVTAV